MRSFSVNHACSTENISLFFILNRKGSVKLKTSPSCTLHKKEPVNVVHVEKRPASTHTDADIDTHTHRHTDTQTHTHTCTHTHTQKEPHTHIHTHTPSFATFACLLIREHCPFEYTKGKAPVIGVHTEKETTHYLVN